MMQPLSAEEYAVEQQHLSATRRYALPLAQILPPSLEVGGIDIVKESYARPVILLRYKGSSCVHCVEQLAALNRSAAALRSIGARVIAFSTDSDKQSRTLMEQKHFSSDVMTLVSDPDNTAARAIGALRTVDGEETELHAAIVLHNGRAEFADFGEAPFMGISTLVDKAAAISGKFNPNIAAIPANNENFLGEYLQGTPTITLIAGPLQGLSAPKDVAFNPSLTHKGDAWVPSSDEANGAGMLIIYKPGTAKQSFEMRRDVAAKHFMWRTHAIAFGDNGAFATAQNGNPQGGIDEYMFMGPTLFPSDTALFARSGSMSEDPFMFLGSHLDMLHQSPYCLGIAHEKANTYWVSDARYKDVCRYDYANPHEVGGTDHRDGIIRRYSQIKITPPTNGTPAHLAFDKATGMLYIADPGGKRILRLNTATGNIKRNLPMPAESAERAAEFVEMENAEWDVFISEGLTQPCGLEVQNGRLLVGDYATGIIHFYDITGATPVKLGEIATGMKTLAGITLSPDNRIWFCDPSTNGVYRIESGFSMKITPLSEVKVVAPGTTTDISFTVENRSALIVKATLTATSTLPQSWSLTAPVEVTLAPNDKQTVKVSVTHGTEAAVGMVRLAMTSIDASWSGIQDETMVLSSAIERVVINDAEYETVYKPSEAILETGRTDYIPLTTREYLRAASDLKNLKTAMWYSGSFGYITPLKEALIGQMLTGGTNLMLVGDASLVQQYLNGNSNSFFAKFGTQVKSVIEDNAQSVVNGVAGDSISGSINKVTITLQELEFRANVVGFTVMPMPALTLLTNGKSVLRRSSGTTSVAARFEASNYRSVLFGVNPIAIQDEDIRRTLLDRSLTWLEPQSPSTGVDDRSAALTALQMSLRATTNPFAERLELLLSTESTSGTATVLLYNAAGNEVAKLYSGDFSGERTISFDAAGLAAGMYYAVARVAGNAVYVPVVRQ